MQQDEGVPAPPGVSRCASCGARASDRQAWCSLCHAPVGLAAPAPAPAPVPTATAAAGGAGAVDEVGTVDEADVQRMLAQLADTARWRGLGTTRARVGVAAGGAVGLTALLLAVMALAGALTG